MSPEAKLLEILSPITTRIKLIESGDTPQIVEYAKVDVKSVIYKGLTSIELEILLHALDLYIEKIEDAVKNIEQLHPFSNYNDETIPGETFVDPPIIVKSAVTMYSEAINALKAELNVYKDFFKEERANADKLLAELGSNVFANAGFRLTLDLAAKELIILINVMIEQGFIMQPQNEKWTDKRIFEFVIKNFNTKAGKPVTIKTLQNAKEKYKGANTKELEKKIDNLLKAISTF